MSDVKAGAAGRESSVGGSPASGTPSRASDGPPSLKVVVGGRTPYEEGLALQRGLARAKIRGDLDDDLLLLVEHEPVLTLGRGAREAHVAAAADVLEARGIRRVEVERGGDVTYHGPGQLVGYPILDLRRHRRDLHWYVRALEAALVEALARLELPAFRVEGHTGVWVGEAAAAEVAGGPAGGDGPSGDRSAGDRREGDGAGSGIPADAAGPLIAAGRVRKVASIGVHVSRWVTWHGFALNVTEDPLADFSLIVPCGIEGVRMTSLAAEGVRVAVESPALRDALAAGFGAAFGAQVVPGPDRRTLGRLAGTPARDAGEAVA